MNAAEYHQMAALEQEHWWYVGLRDLLGRVLRSVPQRPDFAVLDAGCGTGANLAFVREQLSPHYLGGFDLSPLALEFAMQKNPGVDVYRSDICGPELHVEALDVVLCCDVIYVPGVERSLPGLQRLVSALRPGGLFVLNVPAYEWLRSRHDVAIHTSQRFTRRSIGELLRTLQLETAMLTYRLWSLFPLVVAARLPSMVFPPRDANYVRSDLAMPAGWMNRSLRQIVVTENAGIEAGVRYPWGSSVFAVGRKPS